MSIFSERPVNRTLLRKERKAVLAFTLWFTIFLNPLLMLQIIATYHPGPGRFTVAEVLGWLGLILSLYCGVNAYLALRKLTAMVYAKPSRSLIWYIVCLVLSTVVIAIPIGMLIVMWRHSEKVIQAQPYTMKEDFGVSSRDVIQRSGDGRGA